MENNANPVTSISLVLFILKLSLHKIAISTMSNSFFYKNIKIHYSDSGKGKAIVLLHGFLENQSMWNYFSIELSKKYRVICIDLFGHGATENYGYVHTMEDQAKMVKATLNHILVRKYILVGHSMGGYVALSFAKLFPENLKGLCLMNSTALPDSSEKKINRDRAIKAVKKDYRTFVRIAIPMLFSEKNRNVFISEIRDITKEALQITPQGIVAALEGMKIREDLTSIFKTSRFPIQFIIGKQDPVLEYSTLIEQTKNTFIQVIEFSDGHMSYIENKEELLVALALFIRNCQKTF
jgi:pimeloyl-ACP methyl ester carboxylesterase